VIRGDAVAPYERADGVSEPPPTKTAGTLIINLEMKPRRDVNNVVSFIEMKVLNQIERP
jgi:hypothetical protein